MTPQTHHGLRRQGRHLAFLAATALQAMHEETAGLPLFTAPPAPPEPVDVLAEGHRRAAHEWMAAHPEAMLVFEALALKAAAARRRFGAKALAERVRWEYTVDRGDAEFKVNNNHVSWIARELVRRHPELGELIEFRKTKEDA